MTPENFPQSLSPITDQVFGRGPHAPVPDHIAPHQPSGRGPDPTGSRLSAAPVSAPVPILSPADAGSIISQEPKKGNLFPLHLLSANRMSKTAKKLEQAADCLLQSEKTRSTLAVVGARAVLAEVVLILDALWGGDGRGPNLPGEDGHFGHLL